MINAELKFGFNDCELWVWYNRHIKEGVFIMPTVTSVLSAYHSLSTADQNAVKAAIIRHLGNLVDMETCVKNERFKTGPVCPFCGGTHIVRNGRFRNKQRYVCRDCGKSFFVTSNSIVSGTHKGVDVWEQYIDCMMNGYSLRKSAAICGIHYNTAFAWRHKILDALQFMAEDVVLDGIIEADETFFPVSYKGNHKKNRTFSLPRAAHKRGHSAHTRGISREKVCVPCAVNRDGRSIAKPANLGRVSTKDLHKVYDGRIEPGSTMVTDKMNSYCRFSKANNINLVQVQSGKAKKGIYHIQHINNYHSQLKQFMSRFKGVSSKYLDNYLIWNNLVNYSKEDSFEKQQLFLRFVLAVIFKETFAQISCRPPIAA